MLGMIQSLGVWIILNVRMLIDIFMLIFLVWRNSLMIGLFATATVYQRVNRITSKYYAKAITD